MNSVDLLDLIAKQENSRVAFKHDDIHQDQLAKEKSTLLNLAGGTILLRVEDDGQICGLSRSVEDAEEWVMNVARNNLQPPATPVWSAVKMENGKTVGSIDLMQDSPDKPHKARRGGAWVCFTRVGSQSREPMHDEEGRLFQAARLVRYEITAVSDMGIESLDKRRVENYFHDVLKRPVPNRFDTATWQRLLTKSDLLIATGNRECASVAGLLLFGENPNRRLPQAGVTAAAFPGKEKDYNTVDEERIRGPLTPVVSKDGDVVERGVIDRSVDFVN